MKSRNTSKNHGNGLRLNMILRPYQLFLPNVSSLIHQMKMRISMNSISLLVLKDIQMSNLRCNGGQTHVLPFHVSLTWLAMLMQSQQQVVVSSESLVYLVMSSIYAETDCMGKR